MSLCYSCLSQHSKAMYLEDLMCAIEKVESIYYKWYLHKISTNVKQSEEIRICHCESVFAYELYHQIRKIMESDPPLQRYEGVYLNGEAIKDDRFFTDLYEGLSKISTEFSDSENNKRVPDLVLHKDLGSTEKEGQIYLAEIKLGENKDALKDLTKLTLLQKSKLNFDFYIFIYVGKTIEELKSEIDNIDTSLLSKDIVCICTKFQEAKCMTLGEIIES